MFQTSCDDNSPSTFYLRSLTPASHMSPADPKRERWANIQPTTHCLREYTPVPPKNLVEIFGSPVSSPPHTDSFLISGQDGRPRTCVKTTLCRNKNNYCLYHQGSYNRCQLDLHPGPTTTMYFDTRINKTTHLHQSVTFFQGSASRALLL